jgi:hypothetical protein
MTKICDLRVSILRAVTSRMSLSPSELSFKKDGDNHYLIVTLF